MKIQEFYESVSRNYDALLSMGEADMLRGFAMSTLNKLPQERPDIARTDENWENWDMEASINNFQQWLKRHKVDNVNGNSGGTVEDTLEIQVKMNENSSATKTTSTICDPLG